MKKVNKIGLTENEMNLVCEVLNGTWHDLTGPYWYASLISNINVAITENRLDEKWKINYNSFLLKLLEMSRLEMLEMLEMVMQFWKTKEEDFTVFGTITLSQKREEILSQQKEV